MGKAAKLATSPRLQRAYALLKGNRHRWLTTRAIVRHANVVAVNAVIDELRQNGCKIECKATKLCGGQRRWSYRMTGLPEGEE